MNVWSFDLATKTGVAVGAPPVDLSRLNSYTVNLRNNPQEDVYDLARNFQAFIHNLSGQRFDQDGFQYGRPQFVPDFIVFEAPLDPNVRLTDKDGKPIPNNSASLILPPLLVRVLRDFIADNSIPWQMLYPATIRSGFIDKVSGGNRAKTKDLVIQQCKKWGYVGEQCKDDNRCDAIAMWHLAQVRRGKWQPPFEMLFGQKVRVVA